MFRLLLVFSFLIAVTLKGGSQNWLSVPFYTENVELNYTPDKVPLLPRNLEPQKIRHYLYRFKQLKIGQLIASLKIYQDRFQLNDWLYYQLLSKAIDLIYQPSTQQKTFILYRCLEQLGYNIRMAYWENKVFIYAASESQLYKIPFIKINGHRFYNLTAINNTDLEKVGNVILIDDYNVNKKLFSFDLSQLPKLKPEIVEQELALEFAGDSIKIQFQSDENIRAILSTHPLVEESLYFKVPLSPTLKESLLPALKKIVQTKSFPEAIKLFTQITRSCFLYAEDEAFFGEPKPMVAEEVFLYERSDCEDRSALFYQLVKELLDLPMAVLVYPEHVTVGIAIPEFKGDHIILDDTPYYICDPTGPVNSTLIGRFPKGYKDRPFEILLTHK